LLGCSGDDSADAPDFVQLPDSRLIKVQSVGLAAFGPINPHTATASLAAEAFGEPTSVASRGDTCRQAWARLGLEIEFAARDGADPCGADGRIERLVVSGRAAANAGWRTAEGIRPLQSLAAVRRIYPEAGRIRSGRLVLVKAPGSGGGAAVLVATIAEGRVESLVIPIEAVSP
jgi:hypothetical protein